MFKQKKIMSITALITFIKNQILHFTPLFLASSTSRNEFLNQLWYSKNTERKTTQKEGNKSKTRTIKIVLKAIFCNNISQRQFQSRLNSGSIKALLACERCSLRPLLTPFWGPIKHFLKTSFTTLWLSDTYKGVQNNTF